MRLSAAMFELALKLIYSDKQVKIFMQDSDNFSLYVVYFISNFEDSSIFIEEIFDCFEDAEKYQKEINMPNSYIFDTNLHKNVYLENATHYDKHNFKIMKAVNQYIAKKLYFLL